LQAIPYVVDIFRGKTKPHLYTYIIWSIVTALAFFGQFAAEEVQDRDDGTMAVITIGVLALCFKYGTSDISKLMHMSSRCARSHNHGAHERPMLSVILATGIDMLAFFPTIPKPTTIRLRDADFIRSNLIRTRYPSGPFVYSVTRSFTLLLCF